MPPEPWANQGHNPAQWGGNPGTINLQLAADPSAEYMYTATAPPFRAPVPGSMPVPVLDTETAPEHAELYTGVLPSTTSHGASSGLPSLSLIDEATPTSAHAQDNSQDHPMTDPAETSTASSSVINTSNQAMSGQNGGQNGPLVRQASAELLEEKTPLHKALFQAMSMLNQRIEDFNSGKIPANDSEKRRYSALLSACCGLDAIYLILHQCYCCWVVDKATAHANLQPVPPGIVDITFTELHGVFGDDTKITHPHWLWWCKFPSFRGIFGLDDMAEQVRELITTFATKWPEMKQGFLSKAAPPMAYQIRENFKFLPVPIAHGLFASVCRSIGVADQRYSGHLSQLFRMDLLQEVSHERQNRPPEYVAITRGSMMTSYLGTIRNAKHQAFRLAASAANPPLGNHGSVNRDHNMNTNRPGAPLHQQQQHQQQQLQRYQQHQLQQQNLSLAQLPQGPLRSQAHAAMDNQPHAAHLQLSQQRPQQLESSRRVSLPAIHPPNQPGASFQSQLQPQPQPQQSGLQYPTAVAHYQQLSQPLVGFRPQGQSVLEHPNMLPPIISPLDNMDSVSPTAMPQRKPSQSQSQSPSPSHPPPPPAPVQPPYHQYHPHQNLHNPAHIHGHGHGQRLDTRSMQHPLQASQGPLPPPWLRESQAQAQGDGSPQYRTTPSLPSNSPFPSPSHPNHQVSPGQPQQAPSTTQTIQPPWTPQPLPLPMTPQLHQVHRDPAQILQGPGLHLPQPQMHPQRQDSPSGSSPASTRSQLRHFTIRALSPTEQTESRYDWASAVEDFPSTRARSPRRISSSPIRDPGAERTRYYQFFSKFVLEPVVIQPSNGLITLKFNVTPEDLNSLAITIPPDPAAEDELPVSRHFDNSHRYRMRVCDDSRLEGQGTFHAAAWSLTPTHWPPHIFATVNDEHTIEVRRNEQSDHKFPVELTDFLVEGENSISVSYPEWIDNTMQDFAYFIAVEHITTLSHKSVFSLVLSEIHTSKKATKREMKRRLQEPNTDESAIGNNTLTVEVADIFSSQLFDIPVRGQQCQHLECFDLENWLVSRPSKEPNEEGEPSLVDSWQCPICGNDASPCNLIVDDFFIDVRDKLLESGLDNVKKIMVYADGSWTPIEEASEDGESSDEDGASQNEFGQEADEVMEIDAADTMHQ